MYVSALKVAENIISKLPVYGNWKNLVLVRGTTVPIPKYINKRL